MNTQIGIQLRLAVSQNTKGLRLGFKSLWLSLCLLWPFVCHSVQMPDFGHMLPPEEVNTQVFTLNQNYPKVLVEMPEEVSSLLSINVVENPDLYLETLTEYVRKQLVTQLQLPKAITEQMPEVEERVDNQWFHAPWLHWGADGREGFSGLVRMSPIPKSHLDDHQPLTSAYSLSLYNHRAAWVFGKVWSEKEAPRLSVFQVSSGFPVGSVMLKTLWVPLDERFVPSLQTGIRKTAFVAAEDLPGVEISFPGQRLATEVRLLEVDVMVRDARVDSSGGWVFASWQYDGRGQSVSTVEQLKPIGLMWGNDPNQQQAVLPPQGVSPSLKQSFMVSMDQRPINKNGWGGRLSSVVYDKDTSCQSCHATAQYPQLSTFTPGIDPPESADQAPLAWMKWFKNYPRGVAFDPGQALSLDYSHGLLRGFQNYLAFVDLYYQGRYAAQYPLTSFSKVPIQSAGLAVKQEETPPVRMNQQQIQGVETKQRVEESVEEAVQDASAAPGFVWQALKARLHRGATDASGESIGGASGDVSDEGLDNSSDNSPGVETQRSQGSQP
jgi:hypothetical protein